MGDGMLKCPRCGRPEIFRWRGGDMQIVFFECLMSTVLPVDKSDEELQSMLNEWEKSGEMEKWLRKPLFKNASEAVVVKDDGAGKR